MSKSTTSASKDNAMIAPIMIPAIAPVDSFGFDEIDDEALVGEVPVVTTEGAGVDTVEKMDAELVVRIVKTEGPVGDTVSTINAVFDNCKLVVLAAILEADDEPSEPNAMSCCAV
jgi:hypothetical protein